MAINMDELVRLKHFDALAAKADAKIKEMENKKMDKVTGATADNIATFDSDGKVLDSGISIATVEEGKALLDSIFGGEEEPQFTGFTFSLTNPVFGTNGFGGKGLDLIAMKLCNYASDTTINSITPDGDNFIINYTKADETTSTVSLASTTSTLIITAESENGSRTFEGSFAEFYDIYTATNRFQAFCDWFNAKAETKNSPIRMTWEPNKNTVSFINTNTEGGAKKRKISIIISSSKFQYVNDLIEAAYDTAPTGVQFVSSNILIEVTEP